MAFKTAIEFSKFRLNCQKSNARLCGRERAPFFEVFCPNFFTIPKFEKKKDVQSISIDLSDLHFLFGF